MDEIDAAVIEIETESPRAARDRLVALPQVRSVAQLGMRLHALVERSHADPEAVLGAELRRGGVDARVTAVRANLEDVFVAATWSRDTVRGREP
jgi:ABC-2 type transport system ATP-binding protein